MGAYGESMTSETNKLKRRARSLLIELRSDYGRADCGAALMEHISPAVAAKRVEFDQIMARLRELDPSCPR